jgi:hypothetical protein
MSSEKPSPVRLKIEKPFSPGTVFAMLTKSQVVEAFAETPAVSNSTANEVLMFFPMLSFLIAHLNPAV